MELELREKIKQLAREYCKKTVAEKNRNNYIPVSGKIMRFEIPLPTDMQKLIDSLK